MPLKNKTIIITFLALCIHSLSFAQVGPSGEHYDMLGPLHKCPFLHVYNWDGVGEYHEDEDTICAIIEHTMFLGRSVYERWLPQRANISEMALYQHSDSVLHAIGIACANNIAVDLGHQFFVGLYDPNMILLRGLYPVSTPELGPNMPPNVYYHVTAPGNMMYNLYFGYVMKLQFLFFDEPIDISGDFYISIGQDQQPHSPAGLHEMHIWHEYHDPPYHMGDSPIKLYLDDSKTWVDDTLRRELPSTFLIVEPECHTLDSIKVTTDSLGHVTVEWDSIPWQQQWVLRLESPSGTRYNTVETYRHTYYNLDTNAYYELSIMSQCYLPGGRHNFSSWSDPISIGNGNAAIGDIESPKLEIEIRPNPASGQVAVSSTLPMTRLEVADILGHTLYDRVDSGLAATLEISAWPAGIYLLGIDTSLGVATRKLLVK